jgi:hypothetical protein
MADAEQVKDAAETYIYGYPLVYDLKAVADNVEGSPSLPIHAPTTASPTPAGCSALRPSSSHPTTTPSM